ncbi:MAG: molybdopterin-dependent oxidoreductase [SAR324 cluster bacterium]|nr:molybdopterin-dependent oxidoreductase [SAR324 cluster bacterium]
MSHSVSTTQTVSHRTACILCPENCGLVIDTLDGKFVKVLGDKNHPTSQGYMCQKPTRLNYYQNHEDRLTQPLKRQEDGSFVEISWDQAIREIADKLNHLRDTYTGRSLAYYGGGGQGNHLGGVYSTALRAAMDTRYLYGSLAQEKTGGFWVNGKLFGRQNIHPTEDVEHAEISIFIGTNPWQSHGFHHARKTLNEIKKDPTRKIVVIDPRKTETAEMADLFIQVKPGKDAYLMTALLAILVRDNLVDHDFIREKTTGYETVAKYLSTVPIARFAIYSGTDEATLSGLARDISTASSVTVRTDLGLEQSRHSTLNGYLSRLIFLITGNFGRKGCHNLHTSFIPVIGHSDEPEVNKKVWKTQVTGMKEIAKIFPPNILPAEIDTDHPNRIRGLFVDSSNPVTTAADTNAYRKAFKKLELLVVIDVALTETAELAHYVLPASSQFEKWEAAFFNLGFPTNHFHLRKPIVPATPGTLPEPEIYRRLVVAMGKIPASFPELKAIAKLDRKFPKLKLFPLALKAFLALKPKLRPYFTIILAETLGEALPDQAKAAAVFWGAAQIYAKQHKEAIQRAGIIDQGNGLGDALFEKILHSPSGTNISVHNYEDQWKWIKHPDGKIHLCIEEMFEEMGRLENEIQLDLHSKKDFPFLLSAGGRRTYNANAIYRDPEWRKSEKEGALYIHSDDANMLGLKTGDPVICESKVNSMTVVVEVNDSTQPGYVMLPHGYGLRFPLKGTKQRGSQGPVINHLTSSDHCDELAKTPFHKNVPVRLKAVSNL